jgi:hypothetical protein
MTSRCIGPELRCFSHQAESGLRSDPQEGVALRTKDTLTPSSRRPIVVIFVIFFAVAFVFLFVFFLVGLFPKKNIGLRRAIRRVRVEALWAYSAHVHMVLCGRWQEQRVLVAALARQNAVSV